MHKAISQIILIILSIFLIVCNTFASRNALSKDKAIEILNEHIAFGYFPVKINTNSYYRIKNEKQFNFMHNVLKKLQKRGLVKYTISKTLTTKKLNAQLTLKGKETPYAVYEKDSNMVGLVCGKRTIFEITEIDSSSGFIYFTYCFIPNELGSYLGSTRDEKNIGRAKIIYDEIHNKFLFKGFEYYISKTDKWATTSWAYKKEDKSIFYFGIIK